MALLFCLALLSPPSAAGARPQAQAKPDRASAEAERGSGLLRRGDAKGAVKAFRAAVKARKDDPALWVNLAHALTLRGELKEARKALGEALAINPDMAAARANLAYLYLVAGQPREAEAAARRALELDAAQPDAHYVVGLMRLREGAWLKAIEEADQIIKADAGAASAYWLKSEALLGLYERGNAVISDDRRGAYDFDSKTVEEARARQPLLLKAAADSLEKYLQLRPDAPDSAAVREQMEALRSYERDPAAAKTIYAAGELSTRAVILFKPEPGYTPEARSANVRGVVRLRAVLGSDGRVSRVLVLKRLSHGLTEKSVEAARKIKFKPATLNGQPVSQYVVLEYNFNIY